MQRRSLSCIARVQNTSNSKVKKNKKKHTCSVNGLGYWASPMNGCKKNSSSKPEESTQLRIKCEKNYCRENHEK